MTDFAQDHVWKDWWTCPSGSPTQNLDRVCAGGFSQIVRIAWGVWNIHELVVKSAKIQNPGQKLFTSLNKQTTDVEREQSGLQCIECGVSSV